VTAAGPRPGERFSLRRRALSFRYAWRGLLFVVRSQHNAWIHALATVVVLGAAAVLRIDREEWALLVVSMVLVWSAEAVNTAVEALGDAVSPEWRPAVGRAKDAAAAAVLVSAVGAAVVGGLVLGPRIAGLLGYPP
jgi:diacylglycerol kinase (ATP)